MDHGQRELLASAAILGIFLVVQVGALALVEPFLEGGLQEVEDTDDPSLSLFYIAAILVATVLMLAAFKYGGDSILRIIIIFAGVYIAFFVIDALVPALITVTLSGFPVNVPAVALALFLGAVLFSYPEWYVIDAAGIVMAVGAAALFGINLGIFPVLVLLITLAIYDAISVYRTEHMLTLASGMMDLRVPVVFVVPLSLSYTFLDESKPDRVSDSTGESSPDSRSEPSTDPREDSDSDSPAQSTDSASPAEDGVPSDPLTVETLNEMGPAGVRELETQDLEGLAFDDDQRDALDEAVLTALREASQDRDALFIGLGDAVIPTILVVSAAFFVDAGPTLTIAGVSATLPALTALLGTMAGLIGLLWLVRQGRAHAGLPLLNGGAIAGYLLGAVLSGLSLIEALGLGGYF